MVDQKKRRQRKRKPTKEEVKLDKERLKKQKEQAELVKETIEPVENDTDATQRLLDIQNKVKVIDKDIFQSLYGHWGGMPIKYVEKMAKDENITVFERMTAARSVLAMKPETKNGRQIGQYIEERYSGKSTQRHEHTGPDGSPISMMQKHQEEVDEFDEVLDQMSDEDLANYEKVVKFRMKMKRKYGK